METKFCYQVHERTVQFTAEAKAGHRRLRLRLGRFLLGSGLLAILTAPIIWLCLIPIALADLIGSLNQAICFPIYASPRSAGAITWRLTGITWAVST